MDKPRPLYRFIPGLPAMPKLPPTLKHRPAIWECMLGTVYATNDQGETEYFDYDYEAAIKHCGFDETRDPRIFKNRQHVRWSNGKDYAGDPPVGKRVVWILRSPDGYRAT